MNVNSVIFRVLSVIFRVLMSCTKILMVYSQMLTRVLLTQSLQMSGYNCKFVYPLLKRHECSECHLAMRDPVQTECGHLFCKECLEPILKQRSPICPLDNEPISREGVCMYITSRWIYMYMYMYLKVTIIAGTFFCRFRILCIYWYQNFAILDTERVCSYVDLFCCKSANFSTQK